jgi:hypothetical protein
VVAAAFAAFAAGLSVRATAAFFGSWVSCTPISHQICLDGSWWQHLTPSSRQAAAEAMISSYIAGYRLGRFNSYGDWLDAYGTGPQTSADKMFLERFRSAQSAIPRFSESPAAYVAAIDAFYARYPSKRSLALSGVLRCLQDHPEFSCTVVGRSQLLPWPTGP